MSAPASAGQDSDDVVFEQLAREVLMVDSNNNSLIPGYLEILKNGLPGKPKPGKNKILVVGAGVSGLLSAKLLKDAGFQVTLLEANSNRIGGRVKTFRTAGGKIAFKDKNLYAEAGAMRIPQSHPLVNALIDNLGLREHTQTFYNVDVSKDDPNKKEFRTWYRANQVQMRQVAYNLDPPSHNPLGFPVEDPKWLNASAGHLLNTAFADMNASIDRRKPIAEQVEGWKKVIAENNNVSVRDFLLSHFKGDETVMQYVGTLQNLTSRSFLSILHMFIDSFYINSTETYFEIKGGNDRLPYALLPFLKENIVLDARVTKVERSDQGVHVTTIREPEEGGGQRNVELNRSKRTFDADYLLMTVPFSCLRFIDVSPQFSYDKRRAIIELHYDSATKVLLEFSERFWEWDEREWVAKGMGSAYRGHNTVGGGSVTDNPNRGIYFPSHRVEGSNGGVILASYTWADDAIRWDSIPAQDRYAYALNGLVELYGEGVRRYFTGYARTQSWIEDYYAMGEAAVFSPGQITQLHPHTATPEGNVFFAGEHTSLKHAWIEGAVESAIRASLQIVQA